MGENSYMMEEKKRMEEEGWERIRSELGTRRQERRGRKERTKADPSSHASNNKAFWEKKKRVL